MVQICSKGQGQKENLHFNYNKASVRKKMWPGQSQLQADLHAYEHWETVLITITQF